MDRRAQQAIEAMFNIVLEAIDEIIDESDSHYDCEISTDNVPCHPGDSVAGNEHKHRCDGCGATWKHDNRLPDILSREENKRAHTCHACGREQWLKFYA